MRQPSTDSNGPDMEVSGMLHFSLRYDREVEGLVVKVSLLRFQLYAVYFNLLPI